MYGLSSKSNVTFSFLGLMPFFYSRPIESAFSESNSNWPKVSTRILIIWLCSVFSGNGEASWCFSQIKGALDDDVTDADIISCVEFNHDGELLATGDKGGRVVIFQVSVWGSFMQPLLNHKLNKSLNYSVILPQKPPIRDAANTMSIRHSNRTSPSSTTSSRWRLRRRSTRFGGCNRRIPCTFCSRPTTRRSSCGRSVSATSRSRATTRRRRTA